MNKLLLALLFIFPPIAVLVFHLIKFLLIQKKQFLVVNEKVAPLLFPLYFLLTMSFRLIPVKNFLEWLGISPKMALLILFLAIIDNTVLFFSKEHRIEGFIDSYITYLKHNKSESFLVLLLSLVGAIATFFKTSTVYNSPILLAVVVFFSILIFLPLILYHYHDLKLEINLELKPELLILIIKLLFYLICPLVFVKLVILLIYTGTYREITMSIFFSLAELIVLILYWKKIIIIPKAIKNSVVYNSLKRLITEFISKTVLYIYNHIEIAAVILILLVISWPMIMLRIDEYKGWRSNFPHIRKALPIIGMQGTMVVLYGENFGTTGTGIPGKVVVGEKELMINDWNDHKIVAVIPVPPPQGKLLIRKNFNWKDVNYMAESNSFVFKTIDWQVATKEDVDNFLDILIDQYKNQK